MANERTQTLLIGYGNPLRRDDGLGPLAAQWLQDSYHGNDLAVITAHQLLPEFAEAISEAGRVIFIDASAVGKPGEIAVREVGPQSDAQEWLIHDFSPQTILAYAQQLYGHAPPAVLVTVNGFSFAHGDELSPQMQQLMPQVVCQLQTLLK